MKVSISRELLERVVRLAAAGTDEVCGLLFGGEGRIEAIRPAANVAADPSRHFELDPAVLIAAHRAARMGGARIVGHYHSHPGGFPVPSATDAVQAAPDGSLWLIVGGGTARLWVAGPGEGRGVHFTEAVLDIM